MSSYATDLAVYAKSSSSSSSSYLALECCLAELWFCFERRDRLASLTIISVQRIRAYVSRRVCVCACLSVCLSVWRSGSAVFGARIAALKTATDRVKAADRLGG